MGADLLAYALRQMLPDGEDLLDAETARARAILSEALPDETLYGYVPQAGLPKGFAPASGRRAA
jgi:hydroxymethylglutaryl-CoA lyase